MKKYNDKYSAPKGSEKKGEKCERPSISKSPSCCSALCDLVCFASDTQKVLRRKPGSLSRSVLNFNFISYPITGRVFLLARILGPISQENNGKANDPPPHLCERRRMRGTLGVSN